MKQRTRIEPSIKEIKAHLVPEEHETLSDLVDRVNESELYEVLEVDESFGERGGVLVHKETFGGA